MIFFPIKNGQRGVASRWRVFYQRGLPRLVLDLKEAPKQTLCSLLTSSGPSLHQKLSSVAGSSKYKKHLENAFGPFI